ncbi:unnamed protein product [Moneuplotes crassus]|uniref:Uncharacterized protein n=1 Tax=Euplotes crassus TaxID=5936 RepID=A0AAD1YAN5_EUPCR|nr:unnamed protein product [Moneuplotes crassus]
MEDGENQENNSPNSNTSQIEEKSKLHNSQTSNGMNQNKNKNSENKLGNAALKMDPFINDLAMPYVAARYVLDKIWTRFECRDYIDNTLLPKLDSHIHNETLKYAPLLLEKYSFFHDEGETAADKDDQFHSWLLEEDDIIPPKIDCHAADHTSVQKTTIFSHKARRNLIEIKEKEHSNDIGNTCNKQINYLNGKAIDQFENFSNNKRPLSKSIKEFDIKSATSKQTSTMEKLMIKAKVHLNLTRDTANKIEQVPLNKISRPTSKQQVIYKDSNGRTTVINYKTKDLEMKEDSQVLHMREFKLKKEMAKEKAQLQLDLKAQQDALHRKRADSKIDINKVTFDTKGNILTKRKFNVHNLPQVGKDVAPGYHNNPHSQVKSSFQEFQNRLKKQKDDRDKIRGLKIRNNDDPNNTKSQRKNISSSIRKAGNKKEAEDQHTNGMVESGGSFFNSFNPRSGVTIKEGCSKIKKGTSYKSLVRNISRNDYSKTYSNKPFEVRGILSNSQSLRNLGAPKKSQGISFYEEGSLPPIISTRDRYNASQDEEMIDDFMLDQSEIRPKKNEDTIIKQGDITELINLSPKNIFNETGSYGNYQKQSQISILPKYVPKNSRNQSLLKKLSLQALKHSATVKLVNSEMASPREQEEDSPSHKISSFNQRILSSMNWGNENSESKPVKIPKRPSETKNMNYAPLSARNQLQAIQDQGKLKKNRWLNSGDTKGRNYLSQFTT